MLIGLGVLVIFAGACLSFPLHKLANRCLQQDHVARFYTYGGLAFAVPCAGFLIAALIMSHAIAALQVSS